MIMHNAYNLCELHQEFLLKALIYIPIVFLSGDILIERLVNNGTMDSFLRAITDNLSHSILSGLVWSCVSGHPIKLLSLFPNWLVDLIPGFLVTFTLSRPRTIEILSSLIIGSLVDSDHFVSAGSLSLFSATHLQSRPYGHCLLFTVVSSILVFNISRRLRFGMLVFTSQFVHLLRDSVRRGLWLWPQISVPIGWACGEGHPTAHGVDSKCDDTAGGAISGGDRSTSAIACAEMNSTNQCTLNWVQLLTAGHTTALSKLAVIALYAAIPVIVSRIMEQYPHQQWWRVTQEQRGYLTHQMTPERIMDLEQPEKGHLDEEGAALDVIV